MGKPYLEFAPGFFGRNMKKRQHHKHCVFVPGSQCRPELWGYCGDTCRILGSTVRDTRRAAGQVTRRHCEGHPQGTRRWWPEPLVSGEARPYGETCFGRRLQFFLVVSPPGPGPGLGPGGRPWRLGDVPQRLGDVPQRLGDVPQSGGTCPWVPLGPGGRRQAADPAP